ncbi:uncharacterized protein LOC130893427 [Diorhabda carinulata]|uniref:uncharacterized protein LOC130893427 n=1 Tax=Diorhabda carinulata TaxID=1163345 RepID=UPI0025A0F049|nr:uncharacterized protein LOC130893427 [Diorhabda carinulata]
MYAKITLAALLVCALYNRAYANLVNCEDLNEPGVLVSWLYEEAPAKGNFTLRAPEFGETETPISCIFFDAPSDLYNVEISDGGLGKNFVELQITPAEDLTDDRHHHHDDDDDDDDDKIYYQLSVFRQPDDLIEA